MLPFVVGPKLNTYLLLMLDYLEKLLKNPSYQVKVLLPELSLCPTLALPICTGTLTAFFSLHVPEYLVIVVSNTPLAFL